MSADLKTELAKLADSDRAELMKHWRKLYDKEPPASISRPLLLHAIAYRMQEKALGGMKSPTRRFLTHFASDGKPPVMPIANTKVGTRLLREWHGTTYEVMILEEGVMFKDKRYNSLSEVAGIITGAKWSGPLFFGLKKKSHA